MLFSQHLIPTFKKYVTPDTHVLCVLKPPCNGWGMVAYTAESSLLSQSLT